MKTGYTYILTNKNDTVLYIGVTSDLIKRTWQHKNHVADGFTDKYNVTKLVWYEINDSIEGAILREKQLKKWNRQLKIELIEKLNPTRDDLYESLVA